MLKKNCKEIIITENTKERVDKGWKYEKLEKISNAAEDELVDEVVYKVDDETVNHNFEKDDKDEEKDVALVEQLWTVVDVAVESWHEAIAYTILEINDDEAVTDEVTKEADRFLDLQNG